MVDSVCGGSQVRRLGLVATCVALLGIAVGCPRYETGPRFPSPSGNSEAYIVVRLGSGAVGLIETKVYLRRATEQTSRDENDLVLAVLGHPRIGCRWTSDNDLRIEYDIYEEDEVVLKKSAAWGQVKISYEERRFRGSRGESRARVSPSNEPVPK